MKVEEIKSITDLIKTNFDEAVVKTNLISFEDKCELILYVLDNEYHYSENAEKDAKDNKEVLAFCRQFNDVNRFLLNETKAGNSFEDHESSSLKH